MTLSSRPCPQRAVVAATLPVMLAALLFAGCGGDDPALKARAVTSTESVAIDSPEVAALDERLDAIDRQSDAVRARIDALQSNVSARVGSGPPTLGLELAGSQLYIEVDEHSLIRANGIAMSRSDFSTFTSTRGKTLCTPSPVLAVDTRANYDTVAWVLDQIYAEGCSSVDILEREADGASNADPLAP